MKSSLTKRKKTENLVYAITLSMVLIIMAGAASAQIHFVGLEADGEGGAGWNANGSGPEPAATGPQTPSGGYQYYYGASRDYVDNNPDAAGGHITDIGDDFPLFEQALADQNILWEDVKFKADLYDMGDYGLGATYFDIGDWWHVLYFDCEFTLEINGETAIAGTQRYLHYFRQAGIDVWHGESSFCTPEDLSGSASPEVQAATQALLEDLDGYEIRFIIDSMTYAGVINGNGRTGSYFNINSSYLEMGKPDLAFNGWSTEHQGSVGWNADGTGPEPPGAGSAGWYDYYASRDYDDIDPDPNAAYGSLEDEMAGFINFQLQLAYRGYTPEQVRIKSGLSSLGDHVYGIDWEPGWSNYYGFEYFLELDGEPIIEGLFDTLKAFNWTRGGFSQMELPRDISGTATTDAQWVAAALMDDMEDRYLMIDVAAQTTATPITNANGRSGYYFNVVDGHIIGDHGPGTFIRCDTISNQFCSSIIWNEAGSPYYIDQDIVLGDSMTLMILPGTKVAFRGPYSLTVDGMIRAEGTQENPVYFTRSNWEPRWNSLIYSTISQDMDSSVFEHCILEYASAQPSSMTGFNSGAACKMLNFNKVLFDHCTFRENQVNYDGTLPPSGAAIGLWNSSPHIRSCVFENNEARYGGAIISYSDSKPLVEYCLFKGNHARANGGAIEVFEAGGIFKNNTIIENTSVSNGSVFDLWEADSLVLENNIMIMNRVGDTVMSPVHFRSGVSTLYLDHNDIAGGINSFTGVVNISGNEMTIDEDPMFCFPEDGIYNIAFESPCVMASCPDPGYMGAYEPACFVSVPEQASRVSAGIYPNPVITDRAVIRLEFEAGMELSVDVFNMAGQKVTGTATRYYSPGSHEIPINTSEFIPGVYTVRIKEGQNLTTARLVKLR